MAGKILIIDDDEAVRKVLTTHLQREGYGTKISSGGKGVFEDLKQSRAEIIICDIKMPDVSGLEVLDYARLHMKTVPVVMLTGLTDISMAIDVMKRGAFDYVMKPVTKSDLLGAVQKAFSQRELLLENRRLAREVKRYQILLEQQIIESHENLGKRSVELSKAYGTLKSMNFRFVNVLAETIEAKDRHTRGHCNRMRLLCVELGRIIGLDKKSIEQLEYASMLHDIGKIGVNELVLNKEGPLNNEEKKHMRIHPEVGRKILMGIPLMEHVADVIASHHENYDGSGYPHGLKGDAIPLGARIISAADLYDAMSNDRPYRKGKSLEHIIKEMKMVSGTQLDPYIVNAFLENLDAIVKKSETL
ncbi:MAG: HD domain-containing phosphohydrolase [Thermodesulfobacteriota bacterium]